MEQEKQRVSINGTTTIRPTAVSRIRRAHARKAPFSRQSPLVAQLTRLTARASSSHFRLHSAKQLVECLHPVMRPKGAHVDEIPGRTPLPKALEPLSVAVLIERAAAVVKVFAKRYKRHKRLLNDRALAHYQQRDRKRVRRNRLKLCLLLRISPVRVSKRLKA